MTINLNYFRRIKNRIKVKIRKRAVEIARAKVEKISNETVLNGCFKGMRFGVDNVYGAGYAKLLGTYELEIQPLINEFAKNKFDRVLNIGGAEGYYAIGLALQIKDTPVLVYETLKKGRDIIKHNAKKNSVERNISVKGECGERDLFVELEERPKDLIVVDIEGGEIDIFSKRVIDRLVNCVILLETHDFKIPGCTDILSERLSKSHFVETITSMPRVLKNFPVKIHVSKLAKLELMNEGRPPNMKWIIAKPQVAD